MEQALAIGDELSYSIERLAACEILLRRGWAGCSWGQETVGVRLGRKGAHRRERSRGGGARLGQLRGVVRHTVDDQVGEGL